MVRRDALLSSADELMPSQLRAARALVNMSVAELSVRTGLAINTVRKAEDPQAVRRITAANARLLRSTLEGCGVVFIPADDMGVGVRLADPAHEPHEQKRAPKASGQAIIARTR